MLQMLHCLSPAPSSKADMDVCTDPAFVPFDLLDDTLVLAILRCFGEPHALASAALVSQRFAALCTESFIWRPLLHAQLPAPHGHKSYFSWPPCAPTSWRERYKQWHTLDSLSWAHCPPAHGAPLPSTRFLHRAAAVSGDKAYVYGGRGVDGELGDVWRIQCDVAMASGTAEWTLVVPRSEHVPIARLSATLSPVLLGEPTHHGLLMFGGRCGESFLNDTWLFDTRNAAWTMLCAHSPHQLNPADALPPPTDRHAQPDGRWAHSAITHSGPAGSEVIVFGGSAPGRCYNDTHSFHIRSHKWERHESSGGGPSARSGHSVCAVGMSMYVFGGNTTTDSFNDLWEYAMAARVWTQVRTRGSLLPSARVGHALVPFGKRLMLFGGRKYMDNTFDSALHCFDLQSRRWSDLKVGGQPPLVRTGHSAITCAGGFLVFGGLGSTGEFFNDTFALRLFE